LRGAFALPISVGDRVLGAIEFFSREPRNPDKWLLSITVSVGHQIGQLMARRQAEEAMRESEARFRSLTELSSDWYWEQDEKLRFTAMSRGITETIAMPPATYLGKTRWEIEMAASRRPRPRHTRGARDAAAFQDFEYGRRDEHGEALRERELAAPFDADGAFRGYRGVGRTSRGAGATRPRSRRARRAGAACARAHALRTKSCRVAYVAPTTRSRCMVSSYTQLLERRYRDKLDGDAKEFMDFIGTAPRA
jgi:hypothetical protein